MLKPLASLARLLLTIVLLIGCLALIGAGTAWLQKIPRQGDDQHQDLELWKNDNLDNNLKAVERTRSLDHTGKPDPTQFRPPPKEASQ